MKRRYKTSEESLLMLSETKYQKRRMAIVIFLTITAVFMFLVTTVSLGTYYYFSKDLPSVTALKDFRPSIITKVYAYDGQLIGEYFVERRTVVKYEKIPKMLVLAFVAAEDDDFFEHPGIDISGIIRAFIHNIQAGKVVEGGSTITQQLIKTLLLTPTVDISRKIKEAILAYRIENYLTKEEILYLYLNQIYLGYGAFGVEAASESYFGKPVEELNLAECTLLAGLTKSPERFSPYNHWELAKDRQRYVLSRMMSEKYITKEIMEETLNTPIELKRYSNPTRKKCPYFVEHVRRYIEKKYGSTALYREGLSVYTTVDADMQGYAREGLKKGLKELDKRQGYRGALDNLQDEDAENYIEKLKDKYGEEPLVDGLTYRGIVTKVDDSNKVVSVNLGNNSGTIALANMSWARKFNPATPYVSISNPSSALSKGDVILVKVLERISDKGTYRLALDQDPQVEGAVVSMEPDTGYVRVLVGGYDFNRSEFNRAIQSRRQPGSSFKPIIYAAALDKGYTPATVIYDSPVIYKDKYSRKGVWKPKNYDGKFYGPTTLRRALMLSRNVVSVKIVFDIGPDYVVDYAKKLGITSPLAAVPSIALGASGVSPMEMTNAFSVFNNGGNRPIPIFVTKVVDRDGNVIEENLPKSEPVISPETAYIITSLMESVVQSGTGTRVKALGRPTAGKTGTTNDYIDAWFMGFIPQLTTSVWVGFDDEKTLGRYETGAKAAAPIWLYYMKEAVKDMPVKVFPIPEGVVFARVDPETGGIATGNSYETVIECFKPDFLPKEGGDIVLPEEGSKFLKEDLGL
ncbi:MAG: PBP1A family penicillin-binding protein [Deltaproteobacteria bacterium]|uniref:Penicillin-binding protein 1A n=1 Tax=Candidatus Zymogenus saltonus TaxID=2844893 RepID=A0A9D8KEF4_9DELT|nr:PBP1A family penicillin-binding protein [Candidatus Zymogenus saltonus]